MYEVELKSKELNEYVYLKLNKSYSESLTDEDLSQITEVNIDGLDFVGEKSDMEICDLIFFKNLEKCYISNFQITKKDVDIINGLDNLNYLQLDNCAFEKKVNLDLDVNYLTISFCKDVNVSQFGAENLQMLRIVNCNKVNMHGLENFDRIEKLYLQNLNLENIDNVANMKNLKYLNLDGSVIKDKSRIYKLNNVEIQENKEFKIYDKRSVENG